MSRPTEQAARAAVETFLRGVMRLEEAPAFTIEADGADDWVFWILAQDPLGYVHDDVMWIDGGFYSSFGNDVSWNKHPTKPGWQVAIGAH